MITKTSFPERHDETHLPAQHDPPQPHPWLSGPHGDQGRPSGPESPTPEGPGATLSVTPGPGNGRPYGLTAERRLRRAADFQNVFDGSARAGDSLFAILGRRNGLGTPRLGLAISVKTAGNAVNRNRIKRAVRETFRIIQNDLSGVDMVVMARRGITTRTGAEMRASLEKLFRSVDKKCVRS